ncbi:MAG: DUF3099 domain-containing protein [Pseudonocardiaceae bacterium]
MITDAAPSFDDQLRSRRHRYALLMAVHLVGFALAGVLYYLAWWLGLALMIATGALPWIAVVAANDGPPRPAPAGHLTRNESAARELDSRGHTTIDIPWPTHQPRD